jgi:hypothetical protein
MGQWAAISPKGTVPAERQGRGDHHEARGLVQDHRLQGREAEQADEKRQPELGATEPDEAAESANDRAAPKGHGQVSDRAGRSALPCEFRTA